MKTILVVDDDDAIRTLLHDELVDEGYNVLMATNARDALKMVQEEALDLVILDIRMPGMDGLEALPRILGPQGGPAGDPELRLHPVPGKLHELGRRRLRGEVLRPHRTQSQGQRIDQVMIDALKKLTTIIMAGGKGERLFPLTRDKAKPAITFGGIYKIIDFTLSNCLNSGIRRIYVLTQYGSFSLDQHLRAAWNIMHPDLGEFIHSMPPQQIMVNRWYRGTADSIYQNLTLLQAERPEQVLILSGDHVYKMNYREMLDFHLSHNADMTVAAVPVPRSEASSFGILKVDAAGAVENFLEKPAKPPGMPGSPDYSLASMGVYIFRARTLVEEVIKDAKKRSGKHDFGGDIIPQMVGRKRGLRLQLRRPRRHPALLAGHRPAGRLFQGPSATCWARTPTFELFDADWPIRGRPQLLPPSRYITSPGACLAVGDSLIASGCTIEGTVDQAVLSPGVRIGRGAHVEQAILWDGVEIGAGATVKQAIIEDGVKIPARLPHRRRPPTRRQTLPRHRKRHRRRPQQRHPGRVVTRPPKPSQFLDFSDYVCLYGKRLKIMST